MSMTIDLVESFANAVNAITISELDTNGEIAGVLINESTWNIILDNVKGANIECGSNTHYLYNVPVYRSKDVDDDTIVLLKYLN